MQRLAGSSLLEGVLVDWVSTRPVAQPRLPVAWLKPEDKAAELQRLQPPPPPPPEPDPPPV